MSAFNRKTIFLFAIIFLIYAAVRWTTNQPAQSNPREKTDTIFYLRISQQPAFDSELLLGSRSLIFPLLLKISNQDTSLAASIQLVFSIIAWGLLALLIGASFQPVWLKLLSFCVILALSLVRHLAAWDYIMMTESLSVSFFVILLALGIWLSYGWKIEKVILLCVASIFFAFTRDTNAYLLLMLAGMLIIALPLRWIQPRALTLAVFFLGIFLLNNYSSNIGERWVFPLDNIIGRRILPSPQALSYFESCGMPVTPDLRAMAGEYGSGQDRAFATSPALEEYRVWRGEHGKTCYMKWLLSNPLQSVIQSLGQFQEMVAFKDLSNFFAAKYDPVIPWFIEPLIYPVKGIILLWTALTILGLIAVWKRAWNTNPLWGIYILLTLPILPHLFIVWHGDAMSPQRHALSVGLQLALCFWIAIFLLLDQFAALRKSE